MIELNVYLTVDVECSMGGGWGGTGAPVPPERRMLCRNETGEWGVRFLAEELSRAGLRATFFLEMFAACLFGADALRPVAAAVLDRGQDVQMHLHPVFLRYAQRQAGERYPPPAAGMWPDAMAAYDEEEQVRLIERGAELFERIAGQAPAAFRAGGYQADENTLRALGRCGLRVDSSASPAVGWPAGGGEWRWNRARRVEGVIEVPVTVARSRFPDRGPVKHLEISALSAGEIEAALEQCHRAGLRHVVLMFHSFSTVKAKDPGYRRFRPDRVAIARFRRLLRFLAAEPERFRVRTFAELVAEGDFEDPGDGFVPDLGRLRPWLRKAVQAANGWYWL